MGRKFMVGFMILAALCLSVPAGADPTGPSRVAPGQVDIDTDADGLPDFQEKYKYFTNPAAADSDGDGVPDGDWIERQEYAYSVTAILKVTDPWDLNSMNNDHQDSRVIAIKPDHAIVEIVFYPLNKIKDGIPASQIWGAYGPEFNEYLKPYLYANWDEQMRQDLLAELAEARIDPNRLSDTELVQRVSRWIQRNYRSVDYRHPPQFFIRHQDGKIYVDEAYRPFFERNVKGGASVTDEEIMNRMVWGKQMFYGKTRGGCTSSTTLWATIFRALGIPTRHVETTKIKFREDQRHLIENLQNPAVRETLIANNKSSGNHAFNEVYIGGRWIRLDYAELGSDNMHTDRGLYYQHYTIADFSLQDMTRFGAMVSAPDWGPFKNGEFFDLIYITDTYGVHYVPQ